jgi:hypothetical protein
MTMMVDVAVALMLCAIVIVGPLAWRVWRDRQEEKALQLRADINATVNQRLDGESLVSVHVMPSAPWHAGRVILSAPHGYESLIDDVSAPVLRQVPDDYELVLKAA